jgi:dTDP-4-amino-4,6-dideoxygalactose transaminase
MDRDLDESACHIFPILLDSEELRKPFMESMKEQGIQTSIHYPPVHLFSAYRAGMQTHLPLTEEICSREVTLPLYPHMGDERVDLVVRAVKESIRRA